MNCPNCGAKLRKGAQFCPKCGTKLDVPAEKRAINKSIVIGSGLGAAILVIIVLVVLNLNHNKVGQSAGNEEIVANGENEINEVTDANAEELSEENTKEELLANFGISSDNDADYSIAQILDYTQYKKYDSGIGSFSFGYPSDIYNDVEVVSDMEGGEYGRILHQVKMAGSDGSTALFTVYQNEITDVDEKTMEAMTEYVFDHEKKSFFAPRVEVNGVSTDGGHGTLIMMGYVGSIANSDCIYDLCRIESEYVYQMKFTYPRPTTQEDDQHKAYFSDVMYRLCAFSGTSRSTPDKYADFVDSRYTNFHLADWQKEILQEIIRYYVDCMERAEITAAFYGTDYDYEMPLGSIEEIAEKLSTEESLLQLFYYAGNNGGEGTVESERIAYIGWHQDDDYDFYYKDELGDSFEDYSSLACGEKSLEKGLLNYARTFYRDVFNMELNTNVVLQDSYDFCPGDRFLYIYNKDYDEIVYAWGYAGEGGVDGPDDWDYNEELDCFDYHFGPVYDISGSGEPWEDHRDAKEPGNGIYVFHVKPFWNNCVGFKLLGIEMAEAPVGDNAYSEENHDHDESYYTELSTENFKDYFTYDYDYNSKDMTVTIKITPIDGKLTEYQDFNVTFNANAVKNSSGVNKGDSDYSTISISPGSGSGVYSKKYNLYDYGFDKKVRFMGINLKDVTGKVR